MPGLDANYVALAKAHRNVKLIIFGDSPYKENVRIPFAKTTWDELTHPLCSGAYVLQSLTGKWIYALADEHKSFTPTEYFTSVLLGTYGVLFLNGCYSDQGNLSDEEYKGLRHDRMPKDWNRVNRWIIERIVKNGSNPFVILCGEIVQDTLGGKIDEILPGNRIDARHPTTNFLGAPKEYQKWLRHWSPGALKPLL